MAAKNGRILLLTGIALLVLGAGGMGWLWMQQESTPSPADADTDVVQVYKTPQCGCCTDWVSYMQDEGFEVSEKEVDQSKLYGIKTEAGLPGELASCHTAFVNGYVIEGHVPADDIRRLLDEEPDATGLAVPGMPVGSPGMEMGERRDPYNVLLFDDEGSRVYARYHQQ